MRRFWPILVVMATVALTWRAFGPALGWGFTDADAWADVAYARHDVTAQLTSRLTGGIAGEYANFWRPAAMVQFWIQRSLFGWNVTGWHAWDLAVHVGASLLAGAFAGASARFLGLPHRAIFTLVTLLFAGHPLAEEVVPAVARNLDLLLGIGTFGALWALVEVQRRRRDGGRWGLPMAACAVFTGVALGAKELGVLLLPLFVGWVLLFRVDLPLCRRWREALGFGLPILVGVVLFLWGRGRILGGLGGYYEDSRPMAWLMDAFSRAFVEPFLPSMSRMVGPHRGWGLTLGLVGIWGLVAVAALRSRWRRLAIFGASWFVLSIAVLGITGTCSRRALYVPTAATLLMVIPPLLWAWERRSVLGAVAGMAWLASYVHGSPVFVRYPEWGEVARASDLWQRSTRWGDLAPGTRVWLADRPFRVDLDPRRFRFWRGLGHCHCQASYSVQAWLNERWPDLALKASTLTGWNLRRPVDAQQVALSVEGRTLVVRHTGGERQDWELRSPFDVKWDEERLEILPRRAGVKDVVAVWTREGPVFWRPGTEAVEGP